MVETSKLLVNTNFGKHLKKKKVGKLNKDMNHVVRETRQKLFDRRVSH